MVIGDFEKYMRQAVQQNQSFTLPQFVAFATSLVNFYAGSNLIAAHEREDTALLLTQAFNAGLANRITPADLVHISEIIISDTTIDYSILSPIFA